MIITKTRDEIIKDEITRDPIFLFQRREGVYFRNEIPEKGKDFSDYNFHYDYDEMMVVYKDYHENAGSEVSLDVLISYDMAQEIWVTESIWGTREEAEHHGCRNKHKYPEGFRVFCASSEGSLAAHLNKDYLKYSPNIDPGLEAVFLMEKAIELNKRIASLAQEQIETHDECYKIQTLWNERRGIDNG